MFSFVPNLQTQEDLIICMSKPFRYKDSHRVFWKYDVTLMSTQIGKEEVLPGAKFANLRGFDHLYVKTLSLQR